MQKGKIYLKNSLLFWLLFSGVVTAQTKNSELAKRYLVALDYPVLFWEETDTLYNGVSEFYPIKISYGVNDTSYAIVKSRLYDYRSNPSYGYRDNILFYLLPEKEMLSRDIEIRTSASRIQYQRTKGIEITDFELSREEAEQSIKLFEEKLFNYSELKWQNDQYLTSSMTVTFLGTALYGYLAYRGFSNARDGKHVGWNKALGITSVAALGFTYTMSITEFMAFSNRASEIRKLEREFSSY